MIGLTQGQKLREFDLNHSIKHFAENLERHSVKFVQIVQLVFEFKENMTSENAERVWKAVKDLLHLDRYSSIFDLINEIGISLYHFSTEVTDENRGQMIIYLSSVEIKKKNTERHVIQSLNETYFIQNKECIRQEIDIILIPSIPIKNQRDCQEAIPFIHKFLEFKPLEEDNYIILILIVIVLFTISFSLNIGFFLKIYNQKGSEKYYIAKSSYEESKSSLIYSSHSSQERDFCKPCSSQKIDQMNFSYQGNFDATKVIAEECKAQKSDSSYNPGASNLLASGNTSKSKSSSNFSS